MPASIPRAPAAVLLLLLFHALPAAAPAGAERAPAGLADMEVDAEADLRSLPLEIVPAGVEEVVLVPARDGGFVYVLEYRDGRRERLSPDAFAELLYTDWSGRKRLFAVLNITSAVGVAWVALGFLGQLLFTGRMLVQWLASERSRRSVVPVAFWWMSLGGATMLLVYFVWRKDIVGVVGQATGWLIYLRNLRLIHRGGLAGAYPSAPDPSPAAGPSGD